MKYIVLCIGISFLNALAAEHGTLTIHNKTHQPISISYPSPIDTQYGVNHWMNMLSESKAILSKQSLTASIRTPSAQQPQKIQVTFETVHGEVEFFLKKKNSTIIIREENPWIHICSEDSKKTKRIALYKYELKEILEEKNAQSSDSE